jgi:hypothetical protein
LIGPPQNPQAIGAVLRLGNGSRQGAAREVQAGSGYWSQNSAVQILTTSSEAKEISVQWPGGEKTKVEFPAHARELTISRSGLVPPR